MRCWSSFTLYGMFICRTLPWVPYRNQMVSFLDILRKILIEAQVVWKEVMKSVISKMDAQVFLHPQILWTVSGNVSFLWILRWHICLISGCYFFLCGVALLNTWTACVDHPQMMRSCFLSARRIRTIIQKPFKFVRIRSSAFDERAVFLERASCRSLFFIHYSYNHVFNSHENSSFSKLVVLYTLTKVELVDNLDTTVVVKISCSTSCLRSIWTVTQGKMHPTNVPVSQCHVIECVGSLIDLATKPKPWTNI